jgi:hypothetical protein
MTFFRQRIMQRVALGLSNLLFIALLVACGSTSNPTVVTSPPASPTPTPTPTMTLQTYTGAGFAIGYPQGWTEHDANGTVTLADSTSENLMTILVVPNPGGVKSASTLADASLSAFEKASVKHAQPVENLPATTALAGDTWAQRGTTGTVSENGQDFSGEVILLVDNHPANSASTQAYEISYGGLSITFQQEMIVFQTILQSFKFTS